MKNSFKSKIEIVQKGFTLIELLIVIAVLGILATAVLVALDPIEQMNRAKDAGIVNSVSQLGNAMQAYYTSTSVVPTANATWVTTLIDAGELKMAPTQPSGWQNCGTNSQNGFCYFTYAGPTVTEGVIYAHLVSKDSRAKETQRGGPACAADGSNVWAVYETQLGKGGIWCGAEPSAANVPGALY